MYEGHEFGEESDDGEEGSGEEKDEVSYICPVNGFFLLLIIKIISVSFQDEGLFTVKKKDVFNVAEEVKKEVRFRFHFWITR